MKLTEDRYAGITIDNTSLPLCGDEFKNETENIINDHDDKKLLWIKVPIERSDLIPILCGLKFDFHHCNEKNLTLVKKLIQKPVVPTAKTHTVGVGAIVKDGNNLLVIKDRFSQGYKLPGGHIDPGESIREALKREVLEETGIKAEFESIANLGHFTQAQFGESNLYIVCTAKALSKEINIIDTSEIIEAKWMTIDEFLSHEETNIYNKKIIQTAVDNEELKLTHQELSLTMTTPFELFF